MTYFSMSMRLHPHSQSSHVPVCAFAVNFKTYLSTDLSISLTNQLAANRMNQYSEISLKISRKYVMCRIILLKIVFTLISVFSPLLFILQSRWCN